MDLYGDQLRKPHTTVVECQFSDYFDQQIRELEKTALNQDNQTKGSTSLVEEAPPSVLDNLDEPPPLPGIISRGKELNISQVIALMKCRTNQEQLQGLYFERIDAYRYT